MWVFEGFWSKFIFVDIDLYTFISTTMAYNIYWKYILIVILINKNWFFVDVGFWGFLRVLVEIYFLYIDLYTFISTPMVCNIDWKYILIVILINKNWFFVDVGFWGFLVGILFFGYRFIYFYLNLRCRKYRLKVSIHRNSN